MSQPTPVQGWSELLLALPEFILIDAHVDEHDELHAVVTLPRDVQACPRCGVIDLHPVHDWRSHTVRHLPVAGRATRLVWHKRLLDCIADCGTFAERTPSIAPSAVWSRAAARMAVAMSADNVPIDTIRKTFGVSWNTVVRAVIAAADRVAPVVAGRVGIDETVMVTGWLTQRRRQCSPRWCAWRPPWWWRSPRAGIGPRLRAAGRPRPDVEVVALDLFSGFKSAADTIDGSPWWPTYFIWSAWHYRRWTRSVGARQRQIRGYRGYKDDPLSRLRRVLRIAQERLDDAIWHNVFDRLREADPDDEVAAAWVAVDLLRRVYQADDCDITHRRLVTFYEWVVEVDIPELTRLATTIDRSQDEGLAFFDTPPRMRLPRAPTSRSNPSAARPRLHQHRQATPPGSASTPADPVASPPPRESGPTDSPPPPDPPQWGGQPLTSAMVAYCAPRRLNVLTTGDSR